MADDRCPVTERLRDQCAHCRPHALPDPAEIEFGPIRAIYAAPCGTCGERINPGDEIWKTPDGEWVCEDCAG